MSFRIDEIVQAWNEMDDAKRLYNEVGSTCDVVSNNDVWEFCEKDEEGYVLVRPEDSLLCCARNPISRTTMLFYKCHFLTRTISIAGLFLCFRDIWLERASRCARQQVSGYSCSSCCKISLVVSYSLTKPVVLSCICPSLFDVSIASPSGA